MDDQDRKLMFASIENASHQLNDLLETVAAGPPGPHRVKCVEVLELAKSEVETVGEHLEECLDDSPAVEQ